MTISIQIKEYMNNMPDTLNTKKEVDEYFKNSMKQILVKNKDNEDKPKKELNGYQLFMKENSKTVKEQNPTLNGPEVFKLIAAMWKKQKEPDVVIETKESKKNTEVKSDENVIEIKEVSSEEPKDIVKKKGKK
jgi:hypothetical protein